MVAMISKERNDLFNLCDPTKSKHCALPIAIVSG